MRQVLCTDEQRAALSVLIVRGHLTDVLCLLGAVHDPQGSSDDDAVVHHGETKLVDFPVFCLLIQTLGHVPQSLCYVISCCREKLRQLQNFGCGLGSANHSGTHVGNFYGVLVRNHQSSHFNKVALLPGPDLTSTHDIFPLRSGWEFDVPGTVGVVWVGFTIEQLLLHHFQVQVIRPHTYSCKDKHHSDFPHHLHCTCRWVLAEVRYTFRMILAFIF